MKEFNILIRKIINLIGLIRFMFGLTEDQIIQMKVLSGLTKDEIVHEYFSRKINPHALLASLNGLKLEKDRPENSPTIYSDDKGNRYVCHRLGFVHVERSAKLDEIKELNIDKEILSFENKELSKKISKNLKTISKLKEEVFKLKDLLNQEKKTVTIQPSSELNELKMKYESILRKFNKLKSEMADEKIKNTNMMLSKSKSIGNVKKSLVIKILGFNIPDAEKINNLKKLFNL